jgi:two-component system, OmpR family, sensor kinase
VSLRVRLLAAAGAVTLLALLAADVATYSALRSFLLGRIDRSLNTAHVGVERRLAFASETGASGIGLIAPGAYVERRDAQGHIIGLPIPAGRFGRPEVVPRLPARIGGFRAPTGRGREPTATFTASSATAGGPQFRVRAWTLANGDQLILALPLDETAGTLHRLVAIEVAVTAAALVGAVGLGLLAVRLGLRPLVEIETTAEAIAGGDLDRRVPGDSARTEIGSLARALNAMLVQIQGAFDARNATEAELRDSEGRLRRFVADASHELRTPVAAVSAYAELFQLGASSRLDDLDRIMAGIRNESARMAELVEELLLLAKLDEGRALKRLPVELVSLVTQAIAAAVAISNDWPIHLEATGRVEVGGDADRLRQVLDNLLANVRAHTPPGTCTTVSVERNGTEAVIRVTDDGPGLADTDAERVFERFYRTESSRSQDNGGSGLGLAIVAAIVRAHDGTVRAGPNPTGGATFTISLPITEPASSPAPIRS